MTMTLTRPTTLEDIQRHLTEAQVKIGFQGRFAFTIDQSAALNARNGQGGCYVTHWFRPTPYAFEDCKAVGAGTPDECLSALDRYVSGYAVIFTEEEIGRTLGLPEKPVNRRAVLQGFGDETVQAAEYREQAGADMEPAFRQGWEAHVNQVLMSHCPYSGDTDIRHAWRQGYLAFGRHIS